MVYILVGNEVQYAKSLKEARKIGMKLAKIHDDAYNKSNRIRSHYSISFFDKKSDIGKKNVRPKAVMLYWESLDKYVYSSDMDSGYLVNKDGSLGRREY